MTPQVLIKKSYRDKRKKHVRRPWKLQSLPKDDENVTKREEENAQYVVSKHTWTCIYIYL